MGIYGIAYIRVNGTVSVIAPARCACDRRKNVHTLMRDATPNPKVIIFQIKHTTNVLSDVGDGDMVLSKSPKSVKSLASREDALPSIDLVPGKSHACQLTSADKQFANNFTYYVM